MECNSQLIMLQKLQEMEFVAIELSLYLDTHPCDEDALNDFNCAIKMVRQYAKEYEEKYGMLSSAMSLSTGNTWQWVEGPWPWEI